LIAAMLYDAPVRRTAAALALMVAGQAVGCSFVAIRRLPSDHPPDEPPDCTASYGIPAADAVGAVLLGAGAVTLLSTAEEETEFRTAAYLAVGMTAAYLVAATYGARQVKRCREVARGAMMDPAPRVHRPAPGTAGASCRADAECGGSLVCDDTMKTCIPLDGEPAPDPLEDAASP
jgi:hypothetical protein